jgi:hypothetical protein
LRHELTLVDGLQNSGTHGVCQHVQIWNPQQLFAISINQSNALIRRRNWKGPDRHDVVMMLPL